jgi:hypothetical protein
MNTINKGKTPSAPPDTTKLISTALQADNAGLGVHKVSGATGLYLKIDKTGGGSYFWRYRFAGRRREFGVGPRSKVTLAEARAARALATVSARSLPRTPTLCAARALIRSTNAACATCSLP